MTNRHFTFTYGYVPNYFLVSTICMATSRDPRELLAPTKNQWYDSFYLTFPFRVVVILSKMNWKKNLKHKAPRIVENVSDIYMQTWRFTSRWQCNTAEDWRWEQWHTIYSREDITNLHTYVIDITEHKNINDHCHHFFVFILSFQLPAGASSTSLLTNAFLFSSSIWLGISPALPPSTWRACIHRHTRT